MRTMRSQFLHIAVMLKDASNANNGYVATGDKNQKPLTMAVKRAVSVVLRTKNWAYLSVPEVRR